MEWLWIPNDAVKETAGFAKKGHPHAACPSVWPTTVKIMEMF